MAAVPSAVASSAGPRRRLSQAQRLQIARERAKGVSSQDLAARFRVSVQTITAVVRASRDAPALEGQGTKVLGVRLTSEEVSSFEEAIGRLGITKTEALRRMVRSASGLLAPDEDVVDQLRRFGTEVARVGNNLNQVARALNEARHRGEPVPYTALTDAEVRAAIRVVSEAALQVGEVARTGRKELSSTLEAALRRESGESGTDEPA